MGEIKNIVFDFGGVLLDWNPRYFYKTYFNNDEEMEYFLSHICNESWNAEQDKGRSFDEGVRILEEQYPHYTEAIRLFRDKWDGMLKGEFPESVNLLRQLKELGYKIYGLTNWSAETIGIAYSRYDFFKLFDGIVVSGEEQVIKPALKIYRILLDRYNLNPENTLFIDDNPINVESAKLLGINAIPFDNIENVSFRVSTLTGENLITKEVLDRNDN